MTSASDGGDDECVFCTALDSECPSPLLLHRGERCFIILNKFPYNNGHLMVVPVRHVGTLADSTEPELNELVSLTRTAEMVLTEAYAPHGINVGMNLGRPAGAGVLNHLHMHLVPRWDGDTNFMTVVADTRVIPEEPCKRSHACDQYLRATSGLSLPTHASRTEL